MKYNYLFKIVLLLAASFHSCQKVSDDLINESQQDNESQRLLNITARSLSGDNLEYPVKLFAFDDKGRLNNNTNIENKDDSLNITLGNGNYKVIAISGKNGYDIPESPSIDDLITFSDKDRKHSYSAMMMGTTNVTVNKKDLNINITMAYCVSSIEINLKDIPKDTKKVFFSIEPLYDALSFNNEYKITDSTRKFTIECLLGLDGVWKAGPVYIFPSGDNILTFNIIVENENSSTTYSYLNKESIKPSQPYILTGNFIKDISINGNILTKGWEDTKEIQFEFSSSSKYAEPSDDEEDADLGDTEIPEAGNIWNGCIVANATPVQGGIELLLLSMKEWDATYIEAEDIIDSYSINGISNWSLPSWEDATFLKKTYNGDKLNELNKKIEANDGEIIYDDEETRFMCYNKDGIISSFRFMYNSSIRKISNISTIYYIRAAKHYFHKSK